MRLAAVLFVLPFVFLSIQVHAGSMVWLDSIEAGRAEANRSGKLLLVHFWSTQCGPCVQLDRNVYSQPEVGATIARHFVAVKINTELHPELARRHAIRFVPTDMVMDATGRLLATQKCPPQPTRYLAGLMRLVPSAGNGPETAQRFEQSPSPPSVPVGYQNPARYQNAVGPRYANSTPPAMPAAMTPEVVSNSAPAAINRPGPTWNGPPVAITPPPGVGLPSERMPQANGRVTQSAYLPSSTRPAVVPSLTTQQISPNEQASPLPQALPLPPAVESPSLDGMCPVELINQKKWVAGKSQWGAYHRGRLYLFAGQSQQQRFLGNPDYYSPVLSGYDPVVAFEEGQFLQGQRKHGVFFKNRVYLFASEANLAQFYQAPERFKAAFATP
jgi:YHS domain-containing protein